MYWIINEYTGYSMSALHDVSPGAGRKQTGACRTQAEASGVALMLPAAHGWTVHACTQHTTC